MDLFLTRQMGQFLHIGTFSLQASACANRDLFVILDGYHYRWLANILSRSS